MVRCCNVLWWGSPATISPADTCPAIIYILKIMIDAKLAVTLRLRLSSRQSSPNPFLDLSTTRAYAPANLPPFNGKPETGGVPGYR